MKQTLRKLSVILSLSLVLVGLNACQGINSQSGSYRSAPKYGYEESTRSAAKPAVSPNATDRLLAERPGLATHAGSEVYSSVQDTAFYRKSIGAPDAVDSFHYNDEEGAKVMMGGEAGGISRHRGHFDAANDLLSVALVNGRWEGADPYPWITSRSMPGHKVVVGSSGAEYAISLENKSKHRVEVVASVDGIDVLDGKSASAQKRGYILAAGQKMKIEGFRKNSNQVKQFSFGNVRDSAAAKQGSAAARNVGVIGLAVWQEDQLAARQAQQAEALHRSFANPFGGGPVSTR